MPPPARRLLCERAKENSRSKGRVVWRVLPSESSRRPNHTATPATTKPNRAAVSARVHSDVLLEVRASGMCRESDVLKVACEIGIKLSRSLEEGCRNVRSSVGQL